MQLRPLSLLFLFFAIVTTTYAIDLTSEEQRVIDARIRMFAKQSEELLDPRVRKVLHRMPDERRRILATNHYLRRRHLVEERWAMSAQEIRTYRKTQEYREMMDEIATVKDTFANQNPGYRLITTTSVRTLESQLRSWNRVGSVRLAAEELLDTCRTILADSAVRAMSDEEAYEVFFPLFSTYETELLTTVAVAGFSLHGRLRAFDFKIMKGRRTVATTSTSTIEDRWDEPGWTEKLKQAVTTASDKFKGPIEEPYEPWHYEYVP
jgi:hypothetical protein